MRGFEPPISGPPDQHFNRTKLHPELVGKCSIDSLILMYNLTFEKIICMKKYILLVISLSMFFTSNAQKSLYFDGSNDNIQTNYSGVLGRTNRTFEAWVYVPSTAPNSNLVILDYGRNAVGSRNTFMVNTSRGLSFTSGGTNANMGTNANAVPLNKWTHVAFVLNNGTGYMYVDGVLQTTSNLSTVNTPSGWINLRLGYRVPGGSNLYFNGEMDEVRIWSTALTQQEIRDGMCKGVRSTHSKYSNLEAYWKLDEGTGTAAVDSSGNNRTGTINNGAIWKTYGAPVGTASAQQYGSSIRASLKHPDGDSLLASSVTGGAGGVHVYYREGTPNKTAIPSGFSALDTSRHWGVYVVGGSNSRYNLSYHYSPNSHFKKYGGCSNDLLYRANNAGSTWSASTASITNGDYTLSSQPAREFILAYTLSGKPVVSSQTGKDTVPSCDGDSVTLSNATIGFTYQWLRNGIILNSDTMSSIKVVSAGNYSMILSNGSTCNDTSNVLVVKYFNNPSASLAPFPAACASEFSVQLSGGSPAGGSFSSNYSSGNLFVINNSGAGLFKVTYTYTDTVGCSDTASQFLRVDTVPQVTLMNKGAVCIDSTAHPLTGGMPSGGSYLVNGATSTNFDAATLGSGTHTIKYTYTDANSCSASDSISTIVHPLPTVTLRLLGKKFCEGDPLSSLDGNNPTGGVFSGNGVVGFNFNPKVSGVGSHPINYVFTDRGTGCSNMATDTIEVNAKPAKPIISQNGNTLSSPNSSSYQWYDRNGAISGETKKDFNPKRDGTYSLVNTNLEGCVSESSDEFDYSTVGFSKNDKFESFRLYPNPASGILNVDLRIDNVEFSAIKVVDLTGRIVMEYELSDEHNEIDVSHLNNGMYSVVLTNRQGTRTEPFQLIVQ